MIKMMKEKLGLLVVKKEGLKKWKQQDKNQDLKK